MDREFLEEQIALVKVQIAGYRAAAITLGINQLMQSYTFDTGQTRTVVVRSDLGTIQRVIKSLENECATMQTRLDGSGTVTGCPAW